MLFEIDLRNAESRIVDYLANETKMIRAYEANRDPYRIIGAEIFDCKYEEVSDEPGSSGFSPHSQRKVSKEIKLALKYGMKHVTLAERADLPLRIAKELREKYLNQICPNLSRVYWRFIEQELQRRKAVTDLFGKTYRFFDRWGDKLLNQAYNYIPQSTVGAIINQWGLLPIWAGRESCFKPVELLIQEHDSIKYQIRDSWGAQVQEECLKAIIISLERPLTFDGRSWIIPCEAAAGYNLGKRIVNKKTGKVENPDGLKEINLAANAEEQIEE